MYPGGILFCYWTWPREELQIHRYENLVCPGAHKILWLSSEELKFDMRHYKGGQMIDNTAIVQKMWQCCRIEWKGEGVP